MLAGIFLTALASLNAADHAGCNTAGHVIHAQDRQALVCVGAGSEAGRVHKVRKLVPSSGAPGRHPHFVWVETGRVRIDRVEGRVAEATVIRGAVGAEHKVDLD